MGDDCGATSPVIPHPPFHTHQPPTRIQLSWERLPCCGIGCQQPWKKIFKKIPKKKTYIVLCTLKCTKIFFYSNNIVCVYLTFKFNKSHCSSDLLLLFFFFFEKIKILFARNAGIEPAFSVKFGNRTRIYIVLRESNPMNLFVDGKEFLGR
jgi:hypothetical protein